jgi:DNA polymerase alpha subunit A
MLEITKQLTKAPSEYSDMSSLPHVQVADRMNTQKNRRFKKGDMIDYIICEDGTENAAPKRGYHIDEIKADSAKLKVDKLYYLSQQIHPVICRLLEPIEGIDGAVIAEKLGLDPKDFRAKIAKTNYNNNNDENDQMIKSNEKKYRDCEKFMFPCAGCKQMNFIAAPLKRENGKIVSVFERCINSDCKVKPMEYLPLIKNHLRAAIAKAIQRFYENWFVCDNPMCNYNTQNYAWVNI